MTPDMLASAIDFNSIYSLIKLGLGINLLVVIIAMTMIIIQKYIMIRKQQPKRKNKNNIGDHTANKKNIFYSKLKKQSEKQWKV